MYYHEFAIKNFHAAKKLLLRYIRKKRGKRLSLETFASIIITKKKKKFCSLSGEISLILKAKKYF